ncbi:RrF2 family transcriptional regulator [Peribacillus huizhouensis]|uniref:HTH-type transcriptional regulator NsrR n=1 Tax=Peribacillus huizhouensis TaxID=1501239 RepID=A0ABR6CJ93_9BACI|nr:Rrf2 family transcriptional regulator [Peribacillus huizhouensis]MBA9025141.1 Rrf2 family nitric oxide-sensitive transcriptional repressor [Peribacillus huizhouensis]
MRLTSYSDYSLRVLLYLAINKPDQLVTIKEISEAYSISSNHLMKIIYNLGKMGYIETVRGRNGGIRLDKNPEEINIGTLVRKTEEDFYLVECFNGEGNNCVISPVCSLKHMLNEALQAFFSVLDQYTLSDMVMNKLVLREYFDQAINHKD